ncbi:MAG: CYTH and CHAD domain-containing protein [Burkholderiales bacterium]|nr:CYTH and CHAD domain-containing protein [Burkholderiales bacterium]
MEIELKLSLEPAAVAALRGHPLLAHYRQRRPRSRQVDNEYHDTPELDLWRHGLELRLRRLGGRAPQTHLQTLKVLRSPGAGDRAPGGLHRLDEWEVPLGRAALDIPALLDGLPPSAADVAQRVRKAAAHPLFGPRVRTHYRRTTWPLMSAQGDLVELALDLGEVRADGHVLPLCEVELELLGGEESALFELAHALQSGLPLRLERRGKAERGYALLAQRPAAAPRLAKAVPLVPTTPWADALRAIVEECLAQVQGNEAGVIESTDAEYVHQMRIGLRRLRSALGLFKEFAAPPPAVLAGLRWSAEQLGEARDAEVLAHETLARVAAPTGPKELEIGWPGLLAAMLAAAEAARQQAVRAVRTPRHQGWQLALMAWVCGLSSSAPQAGKAAEHTAPAAGGDAPVSLPAFAQRRLQRLRKRLVRDGRHLQDVDASARHDARVVAKKLRYATEMLGALQPGHRDGRGRHGRHRLRALAALQQQLGLLNDAEVAAERLTRLAARSSAQSPALAPAAAYALGWLAADAEQRVRRLGRVWRRVREEL